MYIYQTLDNDIFVFSWIREDVGMNVWKSGTGNLCNQISLQANIEASRHPILAPNLPSQHQIRKIVLIKHISTFCFLEKLGAKLLKV